MTLLASPDTEEIGADRAGVPLRLVAAGGAGVLVGSLTSFGQTHLDGTLNPLRWLPITVSIGVAGEALLTHLLSQPF